MYRWYAAASELLENKQNDCMGCSSRGESSTRNDEILPCNIKSVRQSSMHETGLHITWTTQSRGYLAGRFRRGCVLSNDEAICLFYWRMKSMIDAAALPAKHIKSPWKSHRSSWKIAPDRPTITIPERTQKIPISEIWRTKGIY